MKLECKRDLTRVGEAPAGKRRAIRNGTVYWINVCTIGRTKRPFDLDRFSKSVSKTLISLFERCPQEHRADFFRYVREVVNELERLSSE